MLSRFASKSLKLVSHELSFLLYFAIFTDCSFLFQGKNFNLNSSRSLAAGSVNGVENKNLVSSYTVGEFVYDI